MQKLKKALKKLAHLPKTALAKGTAKVKPAQAAKKAPAAKKKTQPVHAAAKKAAAKKSPVKAPGKALAKAQAAPLKKAPVLAKAPAKSAKVDHGGKDAKKKAAVAVTPKASKISAPKTSEKSLDKTPEKMTDKTFEKVKPTVAASQPVGDATPDSDSGAAVKPAKAKKVREEITEVVATEEEEIVLTDADGRRYCRVKDCDQAATVDGYCRFHYLLFWRNIQNRKKILSEGKLERYIEELTARYPDKYLELLRKDLRSEKDFTAAIQELEIDESAVDNEFEDEAQNYLDEVRGMSSEPTNEREEDF